MKMVSSRTDTIVLYFPLKALSSVQCAALKEYYKSWKTQLKKDWGKCGDAAESDELLGDGRHREGRVTEFLLCLRLYCLGHPSGNADLGDKRGRLEKGRLALGHRGFG